jgi:hypothetical protein
VLALLLLFFAAAHVCVTSVVLELSEVIAELWAGWMAGKESEVGEVRSGAGKLCNIIALFLLHWGTHMSLSLTHTETTAA